MLLIFHCIYFIRLLAQQTYCFINVDDAYFIFRPQFPFCENTKVNK